MALGPKWGKNGPKIAKKWDLGSFFHFFAPFLGLGRDMGGWQNVWGGGKRTRERALPKIVGPLQKSFWSEGCRGFLYRKKQSTDTRGGWKTCRTRGGPNPVFGKGVIREVFHPPLFFHPAMASSPKNLLRLFFRNNLARQKITSKKKITSRGYFYAGFEGYFRRGFKNNLRK